MEELNLREEDIKAIEEHGLTEEQVISQMESIKAGFPFLHIIKAASVDFGIMTIDSKEQALYMNEWDNYLASSKANVVKMVPASGAASRMFKDLFELLSSENAKPTTDTQKLFFKRIKDFAFYDRLNEICLRNIWKTIPKLLNSEDYKLITENLLLDNGLNYGNKPKGLLLFHKYEKRAVTPAEEHLSEGALYAKDSKGKVTVHFTVSPEHRSSFSGLIDSVKHIYEDHFGVHYDVSFSEQKSSTDTIAIDNEGCIFRDIDGSILFRPAGHGALIENLNDLNADIVFIKNIDNVVPDHLKGDTIIYKKLLAGVLIQARKRIFSYLNKIENSKIDIEEVLSFMQENLCIKRPNIEDPNELSIWIKNKLNRPIRVCGMVRNEGEPGGGPFVIQEADGSTSLQILESSQINQNDEDQKKMLENGEYFNPVDIVCSITNYKGEKFDLKDFVNHKTAFVTNKSKNGRSLKALELPGLWNGSMHHWNTIFVEVPISTFNPVKTVTDLLRTEHQINDSFA